jgi:hypothetical protein
LIPEADDAAAATEEVSATPATPASPQAIPNATGDEVAT